MKEIIIKGNEIELRTEIGNARGRYEIKNNKINLIAKTSYDLSILIKYKKEIESKLN